MIFEYDLNHKKQTKANDCWYACIQMLNTHKHGIKTKTTGSDAAHLHKGILGHRLNADVNTSKHFLNVLRQNDLVLVCQLMGFTFNSPETIKDGLERFGPIMIGGMYGRLMGKKMGHFIVLSGIDTDRQLYKVNDPDTKGPEWRPYDRVKKDFFGTIYPGDSDSAIAAREH